MRGFFVRSAARIAPALLLASAPAQGTAARPDLPVAVDAAESVSGGAAAQAGLEAQVAAWNRRDLEGALKAYWDSPRMTWVSKSGVQHGFAAFAEAMRADFADPARMGIYSAEMLEVRDLGPGAGLIVFRWQIVRDGKRIMDGVSTQIWRDVDGGWKAIFEHAA